MTRLLETEFQCKTSSNTSKDSQIITAKKKHINAHIRRNFDTNCSGNTSKRLQKKK